jgi:hypothetical protein
VRVADGGGVEISGRRPGDPALPAELRAALEEWGEVAARTDVALGQEQRDLVRMRGRQLAGRCAEALGRPVDFHDPVTGRVEIVSGRLANRPVIPAPRAAAVHREPTPWATGLPISAFFAVFTAVVVVVLSTAVRDAFGALWVAADILVAAGLAPSLWLMRRVPLWRWVAIGVAAGLVGAWVCLLVSLLEP